MMLAMELLAQISGQSLLWALIWVVVAAVIFFLCNWFLAYIGIPEPFAKVCKVIIALAVLIFLINAILTVAGHPLIRF